MIIHRYLPYDGSPDPFDPNDLMAKIGKLIMKYQIDVETALRFLLEGGQTPNIFLKQSGLADFISELLAQLEKNKEEILGKYNPEKNKSELGISIKNQLANLYNNLKNLPGLPPLDSGENSPDEFSATPDFLYQLRWNFLTGGKGEKNKAKDIDDVLGLVDTQKLVEKAIKHFQFNGANKIPEESIHAVLKELFELDELIVALKDAIARGDFQSLDLNKLRQSIGEEKMEEFIELQQKLIETMREALEKNGFIETTTSPESDDPESKVSSKAIEYISSRALFEFYSHLENDSNGINLLEQDGTSEHATSRTKAFEFGDSFANIDWPASLVNARINNHKLPGLTDLESCQSRGAAKNAMVVLLDMSGSMYRFDRFYQAKKMIFALDKLIKKEYPHDKLEIIGFGSLAKRYTLNELFTLQPHPVLFSDPLIRLKMDLTKRGEGNLDGIPLYFTNLQRGLSLARKLLGSKESKNRQIILITDGVPTAHIEGSFLHLNYPPVKSDFDAALHEAGQCREENITINTFMLSSEWWENYSMDDDTNNFATKFVKTSGGRYFQTHPYELGVTVLYDYISGQKKRFNAGNENQGS